MDYNNKLSLEFKYQRRVFFLEKKQESLTDETVRRRLSTKEIFPRGLSSGVRR